MEDVSFCDDNDEDHLPPQQILKDSLEHDDKIGTDETEDSSEEEHEPENQEAQDEDNQEELKEDDNNAVSVGTVDEENEQSNPDQHLDEELTNDLECIEEESHMQCH